MADGLIGYDHPSAHVRSPYYGLDFPLSLTFQSGLRAETLCLRSVTRAFKRLRGNSHSAVKGPSTVLRGSSAGNGVQTDWL